MRASARRPRVDLDITAAVVFSRSSEHPPRGDSPGGERRVPVRKLREPPRRAGVGAGRGDFPRYAGGVVVVVAEDGVSRELEGPVPAVKKGMVSIVTGVPL